MGLETADQKVSQSDMIAERQRRETALLEEKSKGTLS
jgi:hypothetical protein